MPIGFHVSKLSRSMPDALTSGMNRLRDLGFTNVCAQIFATGPKSFKPIMSQDELDQVRDYVRGTGLTLVIHGAYVDNPWSRKSGTIYNIKQEMRIAAHIGATGVIVHLAAGAFDDDNLKYVIEQLSHWPGGIPEITLWLEINAAKSSRATYETPEKLRALFDRIARVQRELNENNDSNDSNENNTHSLRIGLCIDTAHLFSCGNALTTAAKASAFLNGLPDVPTMLHLNDSGSVLGSGIDLHERLLGGNLWGIYGPDGIPIEESGLTVLLNWAESNHITTILERDPEGLTADISLVQSLGYFQN